MLSDSVVKVSVLVITYNHEKYIAQAIDSAVAQNVNFDYEIVIGEDCSTDGTRKIVNDFQRRYPNKINLLLPERNLGFYGNVIFGQILQAARGQYAALLDGDDYWTSSHKLQRQVDLLDSHPECAICFHNVTTLHEDGSREPYNYNPVDQKQTSTLEDLWASDFMATCSVMLRMDLVGHLPEWYYALPIGDWPLFILAALKGNIGYIKEVMGVYRIHGSGAWSGSTGIQRAESLVKFYTTMDAQLDFAHHRSIRGHLSKRYYRLASEYENISDVANAKKYALKSIIEDPFNRLIPRSEVLGMLIRLCVPTAYRLIVAVRKAFNSTDRTP